MIKRDKFRAKAGLSDTRFRHQIQDAYDAANFLDRAGLKKLRLNVTHKYLEAHSSGLRGESLKIRITLPGIHDMSYHLHGDADPKNWRSWNNMRRINHLKNNEETTTNHLTSRTEFSEDIVRHLQHSLEVAYCNAHKGHRRMPKILFVRQERDAYKFISRLERTVRANTSPHTDRAWAGRTDGFQIPIINEADLPPPLTLRERLLVALPWRRQAPRPALPPPSAPETPAPETPRIPEALKDIQDLPQRFEKAAETITSAETKKLAEQTLAQINAAFAKVAEISASPDQAYRISAMNHCSKLSSALNKTSFRMAEFDFDRDTPEVREFLTGTARLLDTLVTAPDRHADDLRKIGRDIALEGLRRDLRTLDL